MPVKANLGFGIRQQLIMQILTAANLKIETGFVGKPVEQSADVWLVLIYRCKVANLVFIGEINTFQKIDHFGCP
jgi:hypothetical protein